MTHNLPRQKSNSLKLVYIIGTYPLLTTTFIDREVRRLWQLGTAVQVVSIRRPAGKLSPEQETLRQGVRYLLPVSPAALLAAHLRFIWRRPGATFKTFFYLLTRPYPTLKARLKTMLHFGLGVYAADEIRPYAPTHLHAHFVDRAATVALVAGRLLNVPYSVTAHANDIYVNPVLLPEKMAGASFVATCTGYNADHLAGVNGAGLSRKIRCIYHGLDSSSYRPRARSHAGPPLLIAVGQLKEKKGFSYLIKACRILGDQGFDFCCQIIGDGPLRDDLTAQIEQLGLQDRVTLCGALPHEAVIAKYEQADIFVLPCVIGADGDRDGIPNVILEAMAMELPVVSTSHSGIPEVVADGVNGLLVPPADEKALAGALVVLLNDGNGRQRLGQKGRQTVLDSFSVERNVDRLLAEFTAAHYALSTISEG
jgi:glycosyltransferase involved in cell wall biosynthesis